MPQLRVYRSFIKKAADSGKYLIIWDDKRRYEGRFKGFDPQGEFVILVDVLVRDENEEIESPEILIPIENIKIVSTETEEERRKRIASQKEIQTGVLMPGVKPEAVAEIPVPAPEKVASEEVVPQKEPVVEQAEKLSVPSAPMPPKAEAEPEKKEEAEAESRKMEQEAVSAGLTPEEKAFEEKTQPEKKEANKEDTLVSVLESDVDTSILSGETRELIEELSKKAAVRPEGEKVEAAEPGPAPVAEASAVKEKPEPQPAKPSPEVKPEAAVQKTSSATESAYGTKAAPAAGVRAEARQPVSAEPETKKAATTIIEEKSRKAASSKIFAEGKTKKPDIPRRKVDIATLILDILIVILGIVAIGILAVTFLGIKLPF